MSAIVVPVVVIVLSFFATEGLSYAAHRWVMHGVGMGWHRSHHRSYGAERHGVERNDLFPLCFSVLGVALFALATMGPAIGVLLWVAIGVTLYGACYLVVHELYIHRRLRARPPANPYLEWLRESHDLHHRFGGEPYGMLVPLVGRALRERARR